MPVHCTQPRQPNLCFLLSALYVVCLEHPSAPTPQVHTANFRLSESGAQIGVFHQAPSSLCFSQCESLPVLTAGIDTALRNCPSFESFDCMHCIVHYYHLRTDSAAVTGIRKRRRLLEALLSILQVDDKPIADQRSCK